MRKLFFPLLLFVSGLLSAQTEITLYVPPSGSDHRPGTAAKPMAILEYAWKKASRQAGRRSITIYCEGTNYLSTPILIANETSDTPKHPVHFSSYPGQKAVISGPCILRNLCWKEYKDGIMQTQVEEDLIPDQLFVNGKKQISARYPSFDPSIRIFNGYAADTRSPERMKNWSSPAGGYLHAMHNREWGDYQYSIEGKDTKSELILKGGSQNNRQMSMHDTYRTVENIFEELDAEEEWYLGEETHTFYFYPPRKLNLQAALFEVPQVGSLFVLKGKPGSPVRHISTNHLELTQTLRTSMKTDEPLLRSDWRIYRRGALMVENAEECSMTGCYLHDIGNNAIFFSSYNHNHYVSQNHITRVGTSAVCLVGSPGAVRSPLLEYGKSQTQEEMDKGTSPLTPSYPLDYLVDDDLVHSIGEIGKQGAGIRLSMSTRITIRNSNIYDLPRAGTNVSEGTWGGHVIEGNDIFDTVPETGDHGPFNPWGRDHYWHPDRNMMDEFAREHPQMVFRDATETTIIRNSRWRCDHERDIDLDDGSSSYHIYNNLCLHEGLKLRESFARTVENNIMINNTFHPHIWFANSQDIFRHNIVTTLYRPIQISKWGKGTDTNFFVTEQGLKQTQGRRMDLHSLYGDPLFITPEGGDYRVEGNSPVLKTGFRNSDMGHFDVQCPHLKALTVAPELPVFKVPEEKPETIQTCSWKGLVLKEVSTGGERSATGLDRIRGILVVQVEKGITALQVNGVTLSINGKPVNNRTDIETKTRKSPEGSKFRIIFFRNQKENEVTM